MEIGPDPDGSRTSGGCQAVIFIIVIKVIVILIMFTGVDNGEIHAYVVNARFVIEKKPGQVMGAGLPGGLKDVSEKRCQHGTHAEVNVAGGHKKALPPAKFSKMGGPV